MVVILSLLTALESLSIDLYLPAFKYIATDLNTDMGKVQISLSMFLGGFALGQLLWGPVSDAFGRKKPLIIAISLYALISMAVLSATSIYELWLYRFLQAFTGSAGVVIARTIVTDRFNRKHTAEIFALLGLIIGVAPIIAPSIGNYLLGAGHWHNVFIAMSLLGILSILLIIILLPETKFRSNTQIPLNHNKSHYKTCLTIIANRQFLKNTIIGSFSYSALMIYISNSPFLIMEKAGLNGTLYSLVFGINAIGMMAATFSVTILLKKYSLEALVKYSTLTQLAIGIALLFTFAIDASIVWTLMLIFLFMLPTGILFPTTTDLALAPFTKESGTASAIFGFAQLGITFILSGLTGLVQNNSIAPVVVSLSACGAISYLLTLIQHKNEIKSN